MTSGDIMTCIVVGVIVVSCTLYTFFDKRSKYKKMIFLADELFCIKYLQDFFFSKNNAKTIDGIIKKMDKGKTYPYLNDNVWTCCLYGFISGNAFDFYFPKGASPKEVLTVLYNREARAKHKMYDLKIGIKM